MTTPSYARRSLVGPLRSGRGSATCTVLACALVLASRPAVAGALAGPSADALEPAAESSAGPVEDDSVARTMVADDRGTEAEAARVAEPQPQPPPEPESLLEDAPPPATNAGRPLIVSGAALAGVGAALALGGGIAFGVVAGKRSAAVDEVQTGGNPEALSFDETRALEREGKRFEGIQVGMVAGGAVVAVTGAVLLALGLRKQQAARGQARLGPALGPGRAGLVLTGRF